MHPFPTVRARALRGITPAGENIAVGFSGPASAVKAWLESPDHCRNVTNRSFDELGVGFATGGTYVTYWTQEFGNPR